MLLAWSILPIILIAIGSKGSVHPAHVSVRTVSSTEVTLTSLQFAPAAPLTAIKPPVTKYVVQYGDTLSSIAARFAVHAGWTALYAANRRASGRTRTIPLHRAPAALPDAAARYTVAAADTLSGIAARLAVPGGWTALYEANRQTIGPDPNASIPARCLPFRPAARPRPAPGRARPPGRTWLPRPPPRRARHVTRRGQRTRRTSPDARLAQAPAAGGRRCSS